MPPLRQPDTEQGRSNADYTHQDLFESILHDADINLHDKNGSQNNDNRSNSYGNNGFSNSYDSQNIHNADNGYIDSPLSSNDLLNMLSPSKLYAPRERNPQLEEQLCK